MSNIRGLSDLKNTGGSNKPPGGPPMGGPGGFPGFPGFGMGGPGPAKEDSKHIKHLRDGQLKQELSNAGSKLVVVDFTASWCGPCQAIKPHFSELSEKYTNAVFVKIDVDESPNTARECGIKAMPTFQFYKNSKKVDEFSGADPTKLKATIEKHYTTGSSSDSGSTWSGSGYVLGSKGSTPNAQPQPSPQVTSTTVPSTPSAPSSSSNVNEVFLSNLMDMGFAKEKSQKALEATKSASLEAAMDWILSHPDDESTYKPFVNNATPQEKQQAPEAPKSEATPMETESTQQVEKPPTVHSALCNSCKEQIIGIRYHSLKRRDYDLCPDCYADRKDLEEEFQAYTEDVEIEKRPLTEEEKAEQKRLLQEKIKQIREEKKKHEEESDLEREKSRRVFGKEAQEAKRLHEQRVREREAAIKKKEREEERLAKEKIKAKLEQDKREREAKKAASTTVSTAPAPTTEQPAPKKAEYTEALIQVRLPDGNVIKATFKPTDPVRTVHNHIALLTGGQQFTLMTNFPKKVFSPRDSSIDTTTLQQAELVPSGTFVYRAGL